MSAGAVLDARGCALAPDTPYPRPQKIYYYRSLPPEPHLPLMEEVVCQDEYLVVADKPGSLARLGMPVDRVIGLVPGQGFDARKGEGLIVERRPVDGRIVHILDPAALVARGAEVIESATN